MRTQAAKGPERAERHWFPSLVHSQLDESAPVIFSACVSLLNTQIPGQEVSLPGLGCLQSRTLITWPPTKEVVGAVILQEGLDAGLARATDVHLEPSCGTAGPDLRTMGPECFPRAPGWDSLKVVFEQHPRVDPQVLLQEVDPPPGRAEASTPGGSSARLVQLKVRAGGQGSGQVSPVPTLSSGLSWSGIKHLQEIRVASLLNKVRGVWPKGPRLFTGFSSAVLL